MRSLWLGLILMLCAGTSGQLCAQTGPSASISATQAAQLQDLGLLAQRLQRQAVERERSISVDLRSASLAFDRGEVLLAYRLLSDLSSRTFLNSAAIELLYRCHVHFGESDAARAVLQQGIQTYPHAIRLQRLLAEVQLDSAAFTTRASVLASDYPEALRYEIAALQAFRQNNWLGTLLDAERASYAYASASSVDGGLGVPLRTALGELYAQLWSTTESTSSLSFPEQADTAFAQVYTRALLDAQAAMRADSAASRELSWLRQLARLRAITLRIFASRGGLARWPDPLLVDLYVLDRAGHLETATTLQLAWLRPNDALVFEQTEPGQVLRAREYMASTWSREVAARLAAATAE